MNETKSVSDFYIETIMGPARLMYKAPERSAVNAVAIVTGQSWEETVRCLMEQVHSRCDMPFSSECIADLLCASGFFSVGYTGKLSDFLSAVTCADDAKKYIVKVQGEFLAVVKDDNRGEYVFKGHSFIVRDSVIDEVWLYIPGTDNRKKIRRTQTSRNTTNIHNRFREKNMNPENKYVKDCTIRAFSAAYGCSWHEAVDYIAQATGYSDPCLNVMENIKQALINLGFEEHKQMLSVKRKPMNGKEFCELMERLYFHDERIFAFSGNDHCVAILPERRADGRIQYFVQDTWDSTERALCGYFVYKPDKPKAQNHNEVMLSEIKAGKEMKHPQYGIGKIVDIKNNGTDRIVSVQFKGADIKSFSEKWLKIKAVR